MPHFVRPLCTDCGGCVGACPIAAITLWRADVEVLRHCTECDLCVRVCPTGALASVHEERAARPVGA
ncbi:MAG: 4Fe-4S binding protein [Euryarchaeota archaeon]|nr:4Fe-4S binding protein [Euryarchaeota archaeon]